MTPMTSATRTGLSALGAGLAVGLVGNLLLPVEPWGVNLLLSTAALLGAGVWMVRRSDVTVAISTGGRAPALAGLLREAIDAWLPSDLDAWLEAADEARLGWKRDSVPMEQRRPMLLETLNRLYERH